MFRRTPRWPAVAAATLLALASPVAAGHSASASTGASASADAGADARESAASGPVPDFKTRPLCVFHNQAISCFMDATAVGDSPIASWDWEYPGVSGDRASGQFAVLRFRTTGTFEVTLTVTDDQDRAGTVTKPTSVAIGAWPLRTR